MPSPSPKRRWRNRFLRPRRESWKQFAKQIFRLRFVLTLAALIVLSMLRGRVWVFDYAGVRSQEILQAAIPAVRAEYARVVSITPEDYREIFDELIEPVHLDAAIDRILQFKPAVVVVDLDTSARRFQKLKSRPDSAVVWARDAEEEANGSEIKLNLLPVRGVMDSSGVSWGLALFPRSLDWTVRTYRRMYPTNAGQRPALYWEAVTRFCATTNPDSAPACAKIKVLVQKLAAPANTGEKDLTVPILHARYQFERFPLGDMLTKANAPASGHSDLTGKIVLLGGSYSPQDKHETPFGALDGVEVVASAVEAELNPQGQREMGLAAEIGLKVILALLIDVTHSFLRPPFALLTNIGILMFLVFFGSLMAAYFAGYRANLVPFLICILIEQLYTGADVAAKAISGIGE